MHGVAKKSEKKDEERTEEDKKGNNEEEVKRKDSGKESGNGGNSTFLSESKTAEKNGGNNNPDNPSSIDNEDNNPKDQLDEDDLDEEDEKDLKITDLDSFAARHPKWAKIPFLAKFMDKLSMKASKAGKREKTSGAKKKVLFPKRRDRVEEFRKKYFNMYFEYPGKDQLVMAWISPKFFKHIGNILNQPVQEQVERAEIDSEMEENRYKGTQAKELAKKMEIAAEKNEHLDAKLSEEGKDVENAKTTKERMAEFKGGMKPPTQKKGILPYGINREDSKNVEEQDNFVTRMMSAGYNKVNGIDPSNNSHEENDQGSR